MSNGSLTGKQLRFVEGLAAGKSQRQAAIDAGAVHPDKEGSRWVRLGKIQDKLRELTASAQVAVQHLERGNRRDQQRAREMLWEQAEGTAPAEVVKGGDGSVKLMRFRPQAAAMALLEDYRPGPGVQLQVNMPVLPPDLVKQLYREMIGRNGNGNGHLPSGDAA